MKRSILIKFSLSLFVIFIGTIYLIWQGFNIWNKWRAIQDQKKMVATLEELKTKTDKVYQKIGDVKEVEEKMKMVVPIGTHKEELLADLQKLSTDSGLMLASVSFGGISGKKVENKLFGEKVSDFSINLSLIGLYSSLKNFLRKVKSSRRVIEITSISFSSGSRKRGSNGGSDFFGFNVSGKSYYWSK